jgi:hypothetical protein
MYGTRYESSTKNTSRNTVLARTSTSTSSNYYYGDGVTWTGSTYTLDNASQHTWSSDYSSLVGYYTCSTAAN